MEAQAEPLQSLRQRVFQVLEHGRRRDVASRALDWLLVVLILADVAATVLHTVPEVAARHGGMLTVVDRLCVLVFAVEYAARLWTAPEEPRYRAPVTGRLRWMLTPAALIDLAAILPSLLVQAGFDLRALRLVRLSRLVRMARLGRYSFAVQTLQRVLTAKAPDLLSLLFLLLGLLVLSSTLMYFLEHEAQPQAFSSIPATMSPPT